MSRTLIEVEPRFAPAESWISVQGGTVLQEFPPKACVVRSIGDFAMTPSTTLRRTPGQSALRRLSGDARGATAVEFGLVCAPFLALIIAAIQLGLIYMSQSALEVATEKASRMVLTGSAQAASTTQSQFLAAVCSKLPSLLNCSNLMVDAQVYSSFSSSNTTTPTITYNPNGTVSNQWSYNIGGANDIVVLRVLYLMPVVGAPLGFSPSNALYGRRLLMATAVFKNEPYQ